MDKNTKWAIGLSAVVLIGSLMVNMFIIAPRQQAAMEKRLQEQQAAEQASAEQVQEAVNQISVPESIESTSEEEVAVKEIIPEQLITITTDKIQVVLTNKGGDVVSYKLLEHKDKNTGDGVEMVDNVSDTNRAFALTFGDSNSILNETFNVKRFDDYTVGFFRQYVQKDELGNPHSLGKRYSFKPGEYVFKLDVSISPADEKGLSVNGYAYSLRTSPQIGPHYDKKNRYDMRQYLALQKGKRFRKGFASKTYNKDYSWSGVAGKYFTMLIKPVNTENMSNLVKCSNTPENGYENSQVTLLRNALADGSSVNDEYYIYVGPRSEKELIRYNSIDKNGWGLLNAKFNEALQTSGLFSFIEVALKWALEMIQKLVKNWGVAIIVLTILLKIVLFPLNKSSSMGSLKMQQLQPQMQALQEKYKDDQQKLAAETQKLYKQAGYNPATGCLPMILQMIILISLYNVFNNYFEFRGASFIPGWIDDLSVGDSIVTWEKNLGILSTITGNALRALPIIYLVTQLLNGKITQYGGMGGNQKQMKFMMYGLPLIFFFMFYNVPSGLLIYWIVSNILQMGQQVIINRIMKNERAKIEKNKPPVNVNEQKFKGGKKKQR